MSKKLTLSIVIPENKIKKSLVLSLVDADSHFYSMRYKSIEFVVIDDSDSSEIDSIIDSLENHVPSILKSSSDELHDNISGENVIVVHDESAVDFDALDKVRKLIKEDVKAGVMSFKGSDNILDKITNFLLKVLRFKKPIEAYEYPFLVYLHRDLVKDFPVLESHSVITNFALNDIDYVLNRHENFSRPSIKHYVKVWWHLISIKFKKVWSDLKFRLKDKFKNHE